MRDWADMEKKCISLNLKQKRDLINYKQDYPGLINKAVASWGTSTFVVKVIESIVSRVMRNKLKLLAASSTRVVKRVHHADVLVVEKILHNWFLGAQE